MNDKFRNKYRIASHRMPRWDYSGNGFYFITLVTQNRVCNLGEIIGGHMSLSEMGKIVDNEWHKSFDIRDELYLDEYIIMPNHLHAIIILNNNGVIKNEMDNMGDSDGSGGTHGTYGTHDTHVETHGRASLRFPVPQSPDPQQSNRSTQSENRPFYRKPKSISSFIAGFKSAVNSKIDDYIDENGLNIPKYNRNNHFFQPNYHDRIIRNDKEYQRIKKYIINNPTNWENDTLKSK